MYLKEKLQRNMKKAAMPQQREVKTFIKTPHVKKKSNKVPKEITS